MRRLLDEAPPVSRGRMRRSPPPASRGLIETTMPEPTEPVDLPTDLFKVTSGAPSATGGAPTQAEMIAPGPANQLRPGERFGDFLILRVLGEGSFATVYLAHDVALDRRVALKVSERRGLGEGQALAEL